MSEKARLQSLEGENGLQEFGIIFIFICFLSLEIVFVKVAFGPLFLNPVTTRV